MSIIKRNNILKLTEDLTIDLCYLLLYRFGGVKVVAITMLIEWFVYLFKDWIVPIYKQIKLELKMEELYKQLEKEGRYQEIEDIKRMVSEKTC